MRFGLMWPNSPSPYVNSGAVAERNPEVLDIDSHIAVARMAEEIGIDFVFFTDGYANHAEYNARVGQGLRGKLNNDTREGNGSSLG